MLTVVRKGPEDKIDKTKVLQAVNGSPIKSYGQKEVEIRINRKTYSILATIADVQQDIIGWDFITQHKLDTTDLKNSLFMTEIFNTSLLT